MRVLEAIIIAPHMSESGAINAAKSLSFALSHHCDIDIAIMAFKESTSVVGKARLLERKSSNILAFTSSFLPNKYRTLFYQSDIPSLIYSGCYDIVHIHNPIPALEMKRVAKACIKQGIPYVISTHGFVEVTSGGRAYSLERFYEKLAWELLLESPLNYVVKNARQVCALSPFEFDMLNQLGVEDERMCVVTNGVNPEFYEARTPEQIQAVCNQFNLPSPEDKKFPVCVFLGNHTTNKGLTVLLDAFTQTQASFTLIVCGKKRDTIAYDQYLDKCAENQRIIFTDRVSNEVATSLLQYADLFVYPTLSDTLPLVILEAMASGLPILSTKVGGIPYQVEDGCGVLVEAGNVQAFQNAFESMTKDMKHLKAMGNLARQVVKTKFEWSQSAQVAFNTYTKIMEGHLNR
jgi:alpha-maltose-1-phosphate synthase